MMDQAEALEEQLLSVLTACDEALAIGATPTPLAGAGATPEAHRV